MQISCLLGPLLRGPAIRPPLASFCALRAPSACTFCRWSMSPKDVRDKCALDHLSEHVYRGGVFPPIRVNQLDMPLRPWWEPGSSTHPRILWWHVPYETPGSTWLTNQQQSRRPLKGGLPPMGGGIQEDKDSWHAIVGWNDRWKRWRTQNDSEGDDRPRAAPVKNLVASDTASAGSNAFA